MADEVFDPMRKLIESQFKTYWDANGGGVAVQWDEVPFTQPSTKTWVRLTILPGAGFQASIGSRRLEKQPGVAVVSVFTPKQAGTKPNFDLCDLAAKALRYAELTDGTVVVSMRAPRVDRGTPHEDLVHNNVNVPFEAQILTA